MVANDVTLGGELDSLVLERWDEDYLADNTTGSSNRIVVVPTESEDGSGVGVGEGEGDTV